MSTNEKTPPVSEKEKSFFIYAGKVIFSAAKDISDYFVWNGLETSYCFSPISCKAGEVGVYCEFPTSNEMDCFAKRFISVSTGRWA